MNIRLLAFIAIAASVASCAYPPPPRRPAHPRTGVNLDRPASGDRSARETRYLEQEVTPGSPATQPPADGTTPPPAADASAVQPPTGAPPPPPATTEADKPKETPPPAAANNPPPASELPYGVPVPGKKGFVYSPYDKSAGFVDVRDISPGTKVRCPYTGKIFRVP